MRLKLIIFYKKKKYKNRMHLHVYDYYDLVTHKYLYYFILYAYTWTKIFYSIYGFMVEYFMKF